MLTNAVNSINFTGKPVGSLRKQQETKPKETDYTEYDYDDDVETDVAAAINDDELTPEEKGDVIKDAIQKANSNVHPATLAATAGAMVAAGAGIKGLTKLGRRLTVTIGESLSQAAVKAYSNTASAAAKKFDLAATQEKITQNAKLLRDGDPNSKFLGGVRSFVEKVTNNSQKADDAVNVLNKIGIKDGVSAFDMGAGVVAAGVVADPVSDKAENHFDIKDVKEVIKALA